MIYAVLVVLGLCIGSFINALVWRIREQSRSKRNAKNRKLSITRGRSICPHCKHALSPLDLIPVVSWVLLRGKCRYCHKAIGWQYPLVELLTAFAFITSYIWWPQEFNTAGTANFIVWLVLLAGLIALLVYDIRWMLLPNRIVYPLIVLAVAMVIVNALFFDGGPALVRDTVISVAVGGGIFYGLFSLSDGRWIGGGDVKLGILLGLLLADPIEAFLMLFGASLLGTLLIIPGMALKKLSAKSKIPFGPFLIVAAILVQLFGAGLIAWYKRALLLV